MIFNSLTFLLFVLPGTITLYVLAELLMKKQKSKIMIQNLILLLVSLAFFGWTNIDHIKVLPESVKFNSP